MPGNSVIGALRVDLGLNSAQFVAGLKQSQGLLAKFGVQLTLSLDNIVYQLGRVAGAFPAAVKGAIDHADALNKSAQKAGVTVEALSRLEYAAKLSDISLEQLTGGLGKLSKAMADATESKTSTAATAFKALGIAVTDASGRLRSSTAVLGDIADKFSRLQDGPTKTALALQIFGKAGAELIPLLNEGSASIAKMAAESDRLGLTISTKTAGAAEKFNDTLTRIGGIMDGVINKIMEAALPALQNLADVLASPKFAEAAQALATNVIGALGQIIDKLSVAIALIVQFGDKLQWASALTGFIGGSSKFAQGASLIRTPGTNTRDTSGISITVPSGSTETDPTPKLVGATKALKDWNDELDGTIKRNLQVATSIRDTLTNAFTGFFEAIRQGTDPLQAFSDQLAQIGQQLLNAGIQSLLSSIFTPNFIGGTLGAPALKLGFQTGIPGFASGTGSAPAGMAWVGESGPELVNFRGGEQVIPNGALGGQSTVRIDLGPGLVGSILEQSKNQSIQIVRSGASSAVAADRRNRVR